MARFDVYRSREDDQLLLDCQSDHLVHLESRFVVPLLPAAAIAKPLGILHPKFVIEGETVIMATQLASAVAKSSWAVASPRLWTTTTASSPRSTPSSAPPERSLKP